jgi:hypothetical protein
VKNSLGDISNNNVSFLGGQELLLGYLKHLTKGESGDENFLSDVL